MKSTIFLLIASLCALSVIPRIWERREHWARRKAWKRRRDGLTDEAVRASTREKSAPEVESFFRGAGW